MLHFVNCMLLAFAPHVILYKATKLSEANTSKRTNFEKSNSFSTRFNQLNNSSPHASFSRLCLFSPLCPFLSSSEENGLRACISGAVGYAVTQIVKVNTTTPT